MKNMYILLLFSVLLIVIIICFNSFFLKENFNNIISTTSDQLKIYCFEGDKTICSSLKNSNNWEKHISEKIIEYYKPNSNFIDIGSNYGVHSLYVANHMKNNKYNGKVFSFEIQPKIYELFIKNINENNLTDYIKPHIIGLGNKNETINAEFINDYDHGNNPGATNISNTDNGFISNNKDNLISTSVEINTLDFFNFENISVIKLDVEGYELFVLEGSLDTINKNKPVILIEIWEKNINEYKEWIKLNMPNYNLQHISADDYVLLPN
jgi:FkbM family methyltransferase